MEPGASALLISEWTLISLSTFVIAARIYLRLVIQKRRLLSSDIVMASAWAMGIVVASFCITYVHMGVMEPDIDYSLKNYDGTEDDKRFIHKLLWISSLPFLASFYICKAALLCVYHQVIPIFMTKRRWFLWATVTFVILSFITTIVLIFTVCTPVSRFWSLDPDLKCPASSLAVFVRTTWALNFASDILIFVLPWLIVPDLMIKGYLRIGVYLTFLLGLINMTMSVVRYTKLYTDENFGKKSLVATHFWNSLDLYIGLVIACLPALRPYFSLAAESRAISYVKGKTSTRGSQYTGTSSSSGTRSSYVTKPQPAYRQPSSSSLQHLGHLSNSSSYDMDTELMNKV
ncbi:related to integral membrane protein [Fusarium torulosum]|uniref:Related to integral membrane protein n=1 Tax=Fusarium torulosum TaxID=33205 RepID=A0AAE8SIZ5_9HYPO|nr:related to integral membrane protein [Fusarium torulosum]